MEDSLALLHKKIDFLTEQMEIQRQQQAMLADLKEDLTPISKQAMSMAVEQMEEMGEEFSIESLLYLIKLALRKTKMLVKAMKRLDSLMELVDEAEFAGPQVLDYMVNEFQKLEQKGYFELACEGGKALDTVMSDVKPEEVQVAGKTMGAAIQALREPVKTKSLIGLLFELNDPRVRKGLSRMLNVLKVMGE
jgi:uncharacterized protein YjgD (DUF1641 family)